MSSNPTKKPGFMSRLFSVGSSSSKDDDQAIIEKDRNKRRVQRLHSIDVTTFRDKNSSGLFDDDSKKTELKPLREEERVKRKQSMPPVPSSSLRPDSKPRGQQTKKGCRSAGPSGTKGPRKVRARKKGNNAIAGIKIDTTKPLEFPTTPEMIYEYHKNKPFLDKNEEWLVMELNEYECLVDSLEVIKIIAKHSKFFEVEPDELWEEFFEFVEEVPSYDEIINYDVWQEFRDNKYPC